MAFSNPEHNIEQFDIDPGMKVVDLGVGSGYYAILIGKKVGMGGKVYAVDIQKDLLSKVIKQAHDARVHNIQALWGDIEKKGGVDLPDSSVDRVIIANTLFQLENKKGAVQEIYRILKPSGKVLVIDWTDSFSGMGPESEAIFDSFQAIDLFTQNGFKEGQSISAGEHHYGIIFMKKN